MFKVAVLLVLLLCAAAMDLVSESIPNILVIQGCIIGLIYQGCFNNFNSFLSIILGFILPLFFLFPFFIIRALGAGDIKLLATAGLFLGLKGSFYCICFSCLAGAVIALVKMLIFRNFKERIVYLFGFLKKLSHADPSLVINMNYMENIDSKRAAKIRFSVAIFIGAVIVVGRHMI